MSMRQKAPLLSFVLTVIAGLAFAAVDPSASGPHKTAEIDFAELVDVSRRQTSEPQKGIRRLFGERRAEKTGDGRKVPVKVHLPTGDSKCPVVILSHGAGGDLDTHFAQARHLATHGYVVLCVEHVGSNRERMTQSLQLMQNLDAMIHDSAEIMARPQDITFVLNQAEIWNQSHPRLKGRLDLEHVGMMGHSYGAFTTMVTCGMRPALDWIVPTIPPGKGLGASQREKRIDCGVALSPQGVGEPFFIRESFGGLQVPLLGISGTLDKQQNGLSAENRKEGFALWPPSGHRFVWLDGAKHLDFTDSTGADRKATPSPTRDDVQPVTRAATLLFFETNLKGDAEAGKRLTQAGLRPYLKGKIDQIEVLAK
jgi:predicted dienelactone hydrolase